jgi:glycosyltransferase involved in cell wall biosynthesis
MPPRESESRSAETPLRVAVVVPCLNEERTVGKVVEDMKGALPGARIYVFDNGSTDRTAEIARRSGATVVPSPRRGKGRVIQHMARIVDADAYVLVDGDDTYPASEAPDLLRRFRESGVDMLVATRLEAHDEAAFRVFHKLGNRLIARTIALLFRAPITDVLSGYRILSRDFVRLVHLRSAGFEIETEMTLQALAKGLSLIEVPIAYGTRPEGSTSKLDTWSDGFLILKCIFLLFKDYKPFAFFGSVAALFVVLSLVSGSAPVLDFVRTGYVYHVPRAILAAGLATVGAVSFGVGLLLDTISKYHQETIELWKRSLRD